MPRLFFSGYVIWICVAMAQDAPNGRKIFETRCGVCHGGDANGGEFAGSIVARVAAFSDAQLSTTIRSGVPGRGIPGVDLTDAELTAVLAHLRTLRLPRRNANAPFVSPLPPTQVSEGTVTGEGIDDRNFAPATGACIYSAARATASGRSLPKPIGPPTTAITAATDTPRCTRLTRPTSPVWSALIFAMDDTTGLQTTPVVVDGIMYITSATVFRARRGEVAGKSVLPAAARQGSGRQRIGGINRGVAVDGDRVFMATDNAHLLAFNRFTGAVLWEVEMADSRRWGYSDGSSARGRRSSPG
jgi:alcohol dehydrogenase (cytochrome c)